MGPHSVIGPHATCYCMDRVEHRRLRGDLPGRPALRRHARSSTRRLPARHPPHRHRRARLDRRRRLRRPRRDRRRRRRARCPRASPSATSSPGPSTPATRRGRSAPACGGPEPCRRGRGPRPSPRAHPPPPPRTTACNRATSSSSSLSPRRSAKRCASTSTATSRSRSSAPLPAEGRRLAEVAAEARDRLAAASLPPMAPGDTLPAQISAAAVSVSLREYRPIYVGGAVRAGGASPSPRPHGAPRHRPRRRPRPAGDGELQRLELAGTLAPAPGASAPPPARGSTACASSSTAARRRCRRPSAASWRSGAARTRRRPALRAPPIRQTRARDRRPDGAARQRDRGHGRRPRRLRSGSRTCASAGTATALRLSDARRALLFSTTRQLQTATELARTTRELGAVEYEELRRTMDLRLEAMTEASAAQQLATRARRPDRRHRTADGLARWPATPACVVSITGSDGETVTLAPAEDRPLRPAIW